MLETAQAALPLQITRAELGPDPILLLSGPGWAANFSCDWSLEGNGHRIDRNYSDGNILNDAAECTTQDLEFLIDQQIEAITSNAQMIDPIFQISGGIELRVHAETDIDPWVLGLPGITLVGIADKPQ
ncbi:hypothetical protein A6F49_06710 [Enteractinococcus helveticum]|uniref:Uncharacterized protein n=2 Tax=Enteractinococcus helveticum TaxID=1837282 RepID=A0A1B7M1E6_9MICC|nr:hypothetical protein A6F49_06710 [Enteractinococcus helveticum]